MNLRTIASAAAVAVLALTACSPSQSNSEAAPDPTRSAGASVTAEEPPEPDDETSDSDTSQSVTASVDPHERDTEPLSEDHLAAGVEMPDCVAERNDIWVHPDTVYDDDALALFCPENEVLIQCTDQAALEENAGHHPAGWPADWEEGEPLPDPECHPDFIEIYQWDQFGEFHACWEGLETSSLVRVPSLSDQDVYDSEWERSQLRAEWENPDPDCNSGDPADSEPWEGE
ncbi:hypothetical protein [Nesterenkonia haasae]|uniref:hypothetical protein n=1 Tax=Nesterenkonia haasae TaxID=2587813 RepID=UPI001391B7E8|nr:hypothetical protein [Nesterenkonia haasae]NDK32433.1 hypothetical protein [Nesterenkonia haasae]